MKKLSLTLRRGATIALPIRVESSDLAYASITTISRTAPVAIEATAHGLPDGWRSAVMNAVSLTELNAENNPPKDSELRLVARVDADNIQFNSVNAAGFKKAHTTGTGQLAYYLPVDLSLYAGARMEVKNKVGGERLALFATAGTLAEPLIDVVNGELELDAANHTLWLRLTDVESELLDFTTGVFDIELLRANGDVEAICSADSVLTVLSEITTTE
jgi:hypothetical protein